MKYVIFGCGAIGRAALRVIGADSVLCFADNSHGGETVCGKQVLSFSEMAELCAGPEDALAVVASDDYWEEMEAQVRSAGIGRYTVFRGYTWPSYRRDRERVYISCGRLVEELGLAAYPRIGIYGDTVLAWQLAEELRRRIPGGRPVLIDSRLSLPYPRESLAGAEGKIDLLCLALPRCEDPAALRERFLTEPPPYEVIDLYDVDRLEPAFRCTGIEAYKNIHAGERIFLVGNGPSLRVEDLDTLHRHGEICMGFNKVFRAYDRTPWRADYLGFTDAYAIRDCAGEIPDLPGTVFMADAFHFSDNVRFENVRYFHVIFEPFYPNYPNFSADLSRGVYHGNTVVYDIGLQLAAYMGAAEIYLLGGDHTLGKHLDRPGGHFIPDYIRPEEREQYRESIFPADKAAKAYEKAERYSRAHGFRIFNATRGGRLEAFERVNFDSLF